MHTQAIIDLFFRLHPMDRIPRAGYLLRGVTEPESVAAHSHALATLVMIFCDESPDRYDKAKALSMALVHDTAESATMDIPMPAGSAAFKAAKAETEQDIIEGLWNGVDDAAAVLHREFEQAETPEARLVRGLDKAQMMLRIVGYEREGRGYLEDFWHNPKNMDAFGIPEIDRLFDAICSLAGRERPR